MDPRATLQRFDAYLADRGLALEAVVVGGAALALLGVITRETRDCDVLHPALPGEIKAASVAFAQEQRAAGVDLQDDWLNNGPAALHCEPARRLGDQRLVPAYSGEALVVRALGRSDLLLAKIWALCDRGRDLADCLALAPTAEELADALPWLQAQDGNPDWPDYVRSVLADLGMRLGHGA